MYQTLIADEELFARLSGFRVAEFQELCQEFDMAWQTLQAEKQNYAGRQTAPGAGRKFVVEQREQLLSVLLWSHLELHPKAVSGLLGVHVSTFARIRQRVLNVLNRLGVVLAVPDRIAYKELTQLNETHSKLLQIAAMKARTNT